MIDTMPLTRAARSNEPRMMFVAVNNFYRAAKASPTTVRVPELAPLPTSALNERTKSYFRHLETKIWIALGTIYASMIAACISAWNLFSFFADGTYWFHPFISINLLIASVGLTIVAVVVIHTVRRYVREVIAVS